MTIVELYEAEMAYTSYDEACKDPTVVLADDLRECRRPKHHPGPHASGHTANGTFTMWDQKRE